MMGRQTRRPDGQPIFFPKEILMFTKWSVSGMWIVTYLSRLELRSHAAVGESPTPPEETQERQMSGRPIYTPESGDTQFDLPRPLQGRYCLAGVGYHLGQGGSDLR